MSSDNPDFNVTPYLPRRITELWMDCDATQAQSRLCRWYQNIM